MIKTTQMLNRRTVGIAAAVAFSFRACGGAMGEGPRQQQPVTQEVSQAIDAGSIEIEGTNAVPQNQPQNTQNVQQRAYTTNTNPFELDSRMREIVNGLVGDNSAVVNAFFNRFHRGGNEGVTVLDMNGRPPRTAAEARDNGGDCTDLANFAISVLREKRAPGGVLVVHFDSAPANVQHMVPYYQNQGREIIIDLQASRLGETAQGHPTVIMRMTFDQAAEMYHREMGDYFRDQGQSGQAMAAYGRAAQIFDNDAYVHQNLGVLNERAGNMDEASRHYQRASQLDPARYRRDQRRGTYNEELQAAQQAVSESRWADCVTHFQAALNSGERISDSERSSIQQNISACRQRAGQ